MAEPRFVLLDRDGTLNVECHHLSRPSQLQLLPRVIEGLQLLRAYGHGLLVATNQSVVGRGIIDSSQLEGIHARLAQLLAAGGVTLDGIYCCPHTPDEGCGCRKPAPGLVLRAFPYSIAFTTLGGGSAVASRASSWD